METSNKNTGKVAWQSPSNIAIVKYWGKYGLQFPLNPSISFTLSKAHTQTEIEYLPHSESKQINIEYYFEYQRSSQFEAKVAKYLHSLSNDFPFLLHYKLIIHSKNTFPHSAGIASSASSMSALALCLMSLSQQLDNNEHNEQKFWTKASHYARLGSGSASRSLFPYAALWGKTELIQESAQEYALGLGNRIHSEFKSLQDSIIIVDAKKKQVSSRAGHALMNNHPYKAARLQQANGNIQKLLSALEKGDWESFIEISENEALSLIRLMSSSPWYSLLKAGTLEIINRIREFRISTKIPVCFTLDAGPNVHILYPQRVKNKVLEFINKDLLIFAAEKKIIHDKTGNAPIRLI